MKTSNELKTIHPLNALRGRVRVSGDKSMSHRAVLFSAMAQGTSHISGVLDSADVQSSISAVRALGARISLQKQTDGSLAGEIEGWGSAGPDRACQTIDCGNSGTTARLLMGVLAPWDIKVRLGGDSSLCKRPMGRILNPLCEMGVTYAQNFDEAHVSCENSHELRAQGLCVNDMLANNSDESLANSAKNKPREVTLPIVVQGTPHIVPLTYSTPVASAQLKSALLIAGLYATGETQIKEAHPSRDHTERMLAMFGADVQFGKCWAKLCGPQVLRACNFSVPGDPSSAAFILCAALLLPGSKVCVENVSLNEGRIGFLRVLERMGATISIEVRENNSSADNFSKNNSNKNNFDKSNLRETSMSEADAGNFGTSKETRKESSDLCELTSVQTPTKELSGDVSVSYCEHLKAQTIEAHDIPSLIDEVPLLALVAARAQGVSVFCGVGELRVKESNRLDAIIAGLGQIGIRAWTKNDDLFIEGQPNFVANKEITFDSLGDHRLAMTWAVAGCAGFSGSAPVYIKNFECVNISYPNFLSDLEKLAKH